MIKSFNDTHILIIHKCIIKRLSLGLYCEKLEFVEVFKKQIINN